MFTKVAALLSAEFVARIIAGGGQGPGRADIPFTVFLGDPG
jgi:hypothetical protein